MSNSFLGKSGKAASGTSALAGRRTGRPISRKLLYRRLGPIVIVILALSVFALQQSEAQGRPELKRPEDATQEKPAETKKKKNEKGPRAVGLLQLSSGKATLIPIAILIDGKFHDASVYKADPVPMALEGGTVYEVEQTGESQGLFTVNGALHSKRPGATSPWLGSGSYVLNGAEPTKKTRKAEDMPVGLDNSTDAPPRLTRGSESKTPAPSGPGSASTPGSSPGAGSSEKPGTSQPASGSSAGASGQDAQKTTTASTPAADQGAKGQAVPGQASPGQAAPSQTSQGPASQTSSSQSSSTEGSASQGQASGNYYRPTLRRGKPTDTARQEEESTPKVNKSGSPATAGAATQSPVQFVPAISDAGGPDAQSYKFFWKEGEEDERRQQMLALAADEVRAYVTAREKGAIPAKPPAKNAGVKAGPTAHKPAAKPAQPVFENTQFRAFDVWKNGQVVMILCAEAHLPPTTGAAAAPELYDVAIAARTDIYGNLRKLYSGVTDKFHLDVTPRLELIDAVDADGDGRGELLFRETTDAGSGYVIYRATADKLWKMFDSLGAE